jgi:hypothetical protein
MAWMIGRLAVNVLNEQLSNGGENWSCSGSQSVRVRDGSPRGRKVLLRGSATELAVDLFDNWLGPIETEVRPRAREFIDGLIRDKSVHPLPMAGTISLPS